MRRQIAIFAIVIVAVLWMAASPLIPQGHLPRPLVPVTATLRDAPGDAVFSDHLGSYSNGTGISAYIMTDGSLQIDIKWTSGRLVNFVFPKANRVRPPYDPENPDSIDTTKFCLYNPASLNPPQTDIVPNRETIFYTYNGSGFAPPKYDLLSMIPGQVERVRSWIIFYDYNSWDGYTVAENESICESGDTNAKHGYVWFKAYDMDGDLTTVERWEITPWNPAWDNDPLAKGWANLWRYLPAKKGVTTKCDYGNFAMPFMLTLDRVK